MQREKTSYRSYSKEELIDLIIDKNKKIDLLISMAFKYNNQFNSLSKNFNSDYMKLVD